MCLRIEFLVGIPDFPGLSRDQNISTVPPRSAVAFAVPLPLPTPSAFVPATGHDASELVAASTHTAHARCTRIKNIYIYIIFLNFHCAYLSPSPLLLSSVFPPPLLFVSHQDRRKSLPVLRLLRLQKGQKSMENCRPHWHPHWASPETQKMEQVTCFSLGRRFYNAFTMFLQVKILSFIFKQRTISLDTHG